MISINFVQSLRHSCIPGSGSRIQRAKLLLSSLIHQRLITTASEPQTQVKVSASEQAAAGLHHCMPQKRKKVLPCGWSSLHPRIPPGPQLHKVRAAKRLRGKAAPPLACGRSSPQDTTCTPAIESRKPLAKPASSGFSRCIAKNRNI